MEKKKYSAEEVAKILQSEGYDISKRTVNYYAFDKKLFEVKETGKNCFTDEELDKIRGIRILREYTNFTLNQIKEIINQYPLPEIMKMCESRLQSVSYSYGGDCVTASACNAGSCSSFTAETQNSIPEHSTSGVSKTSLFLSPALLKSPAPEQLRLMITLP